MNWYQAKNRMACNLIERVAYVDNVSCFFYLYNNIVYRRWDNITTKVIGPMRPDTSFFVVEEG